MNMQHKCNCTTNKGCNIRNLIKSIKKQLKYKNISVIKDSETTLRIEIISDDFVGMDYYTRCKTIDKALSKLPFYGDYLFIYKLLTPAEKNNPIEYKFKKIKFNNRVARVVNKFRLKYKITKKQLAHIAGVSETVITEIEKGNKNVELENIIKVLISLDKHIESKL